MKFLHGLAFLMFAYSANAVYRCDRPGAICLGTCDTATGACTGCPADREGTGCQFLIAGKEAGGCSGVTCENSGVCYEEGGTTACDCAPRWNGDTCNVDEYALDCDATTITSFTVDNVWGAGYLYVLGHHDTATCFVGDGTAIPSLTSILFAGGPCSSATVMDGAVATMQFVFRTNDAVIQESDELITVRCGTGENVEASVTITEVTANEATDLENVAAGAVPVSADVDIGIFDAADAAITGAVLLGDLVTVKLDLSATGQANFVKIRVEDCTAYGLVDKSGPSVALLELGCPGTEMDLDQDPQISGTEVSFVVEAFKFNGVDSVFLFCTVKVCAVAADCDATTCGAAGAVGYGRKKRDTGAVENQPVGKAFRVIDPLEQAAKTIQEFKDTKACYQTWEMTATVVALAVALVIVLLICIILIVKAILRNRATKTYREDVSETASTAHFPHLPTIVSNKA